MNPTAKNLSTANADFQTALYERKITAKTYRLFEAICF